MKHELKAVGPGITPQSDYERRTLAELQRRGATFDGTYHRATVLHKGQCRAARGDVCNCYPGITLYMTDSDVPEIVEIVEVP